MPYPGPGTFPGPGLFPGLGTGGGGIPAFAIPAVNPNWPLVGIEVDFTQGPPSLPGVNRRSINAKYRRLTVRQIAIDRGRQYELDQVQAGTATLAVVDPLELLNPDNPASPYNSGGNTITPYRAIRVFAVWPNQPGSGNILAASDPSFELGTGGWLPNGGGTIVAQSSSVAFLGTYSVVTTQSGAGMAFGAANGYSTIPGITYTFSVVARPHAGADVTLTVTDAAGHATSSATATAQDAWTRLSVSWTSIDTCEKIVAYSSNTSGWFYLDTEQLEFGSTPSSYTTIGPTTFNLFTGYVERFPTTYDMGGMRATRPLVAVDALAILSRTTVSQSYQATIAADSPALYIPYSDTAPANLILNQASVAMPPPSNAVIARGTEDTATGGTAQWSGDSAPDGSPALALSLQNSAGLATPVQYMSVDMPHTITYSVSTAGASFEAWVKWTSGHFHGPLWAFNPGTGTPYTQTWGDTTLPFVGLVYTTTGLVVAVNIPTRAVGDIFLTVPAGSSGAFNSNDPTNLTGDGQWHYYAIVLRPNGANTGWVVDIQIDTHTTTLTPSPAATGYDTFAFNQLLAEALLTFGDTEAKISVANAAYYPSILSAAQRLAHYNRGIGYLGELSGARVARLLSAYWSASASAVNVAPGQLAMAADYGYAPTPAQARTVLDVIQEIQESERGLVYADRNGVVVFEDRTTRSSGFPNWILGENPAGASPAEYPYSDYSADHDPTYTFSQANLTRPLNANYPPQPQPLPANPRYGQRVLTQQLQCNDDFTLGQAATFYLTRYAAPKTRLAKLTLNPAANPNLWPVALGLEISQQNTVTRRNSGVTVMGDHYVEKISHRIDPGNGIWTVDLQTSPVFTSSANAWSLGSGVLGTSTVPVY